MQYIDIIINNDSIKKKIKNTFVGTAEYVSPEVLNDNEIGYEVDIWAIGIIIYQMFTGYTPFRDKTEYLTFKRIQDLNYSFPIGFPDDAADLIKNLLQIDPTERLGSGSKGSINDFSALKEHNFFKGVIFDNINDKSPPFMEEFKIIPKRIKSKSKDYNENTSRHGTVKVIKSDIIEKKSPWLHYNTRKVVLDSSPKIEYIDPNKNIVKVIIFNKGCNLFN